MQLKLINFNETGDLQPVRPFNDDGGAAFPMPNGKGEQDDDAVFLDTAQKRLQIAVAGWQENFDIMKADLAFLGGEQWDEDDLALRRMQRRPALTFNRLQPNVDLVSGRQRKQKSSINLVQRTVSDDIQNAYHHKQLLQSQGTQVTPGPNMEKTMQSVSGRQYTRTEVFESFIRNIEYASRAKVHYMEAALQAIESGLGWLRVRSDYRSKKTFEQDLIIESILDRFSVLIDPYCRQVDMADADYCFLTTVLSRESFQKQYPNAAAEPQGFADLTDHDDREVDTVHVMEYYWREVEEKKLVMFSDGKTVYSDELQPQEMFIMKQQGIVPVDNRDVQVKCVYWSLITPSEVLEPKRSWPGERIPVLPIIGKRKYINRKRIYVGLCTNAKDPQRAYNVAKSAAVDTINTSTRAKWLFDKRSIDEKDLAIWQNATDPSITALPYNGANGVEKPQQIMVTQTPVAELQVALSTADDIKATTGIFDASLGAKGNETSGVAISGRQQQGDDITYVFQDNVDVGIEAVGRVLVDAIPVFTDTERTVRMMGKDGSEDFIMVNTYVDKDGSQRLINDLSAAEFDISVETKPYSDSQKIEAVQTIGDILKALPNAAPFISDLLIREVDTPFSQEMADRLRRTVPKNILEDADPNNPPPPDPQQQAALAMHQQQMQLESAKIDAEKEKAGATVARARSDAFKAQHETARAFAPQPQPQPSGAENKADAGGKNEKGDEHIKEIVTQEIINLVKAGILSVNQNPAPASQPAAGGQPQQQEA